MSQKLDAVFVREYLLLQKADSASAKKIKRKMGKKKIYLETRYYNNLENDGIGILKNFITLKKHKPGFFGVIIDTNNLIHDPFQIPVFPLQWDIVCLESDINKYDFKNPLNTKFFCSTEIHNTGHFVVNLRSSFKLISILKHSKTWSEFIKYLNFVQLFTVTQFPYSNPEHPIKHAKTILNVKELSTVFDKQFQSKTNTERWSILPSISLVCILKDTQHFFYNLYAFLKLEYPREKLQLVIFDDQKLDKKLQHLLPPNDNRIKIVAIDPTDKKLPLGYKLNMALKYCETDVVFHFFNDNIYLTQNFYDIIKAFLLSGSDIICSVDTLYSNNTISKELDIANMMYNKKFWQVLFYEDSFETKDQDVLDLFLRNRMSCVKYLPSLFFSFKRETSLSENKLPFDVTSLIPKQLTEAYKMSC